MDGIQESVGPQFGIDALAVAYAAGKQHGEGRQILVFAAQPVTQPGAHAGPVALLGPRLQKGKGRVVVDRLGVHGPDDADVIHNLRRVREQVADPGPRLTVLLEITERAHQGEGGLISGHAGQPLPSPDRLG